MEDRKARPQNLDLQAVRKREVFLVTGGSGFLGSRLLALLARECPASRTIVVSRKWKRPPPGSPPSLRAVRGDLCDRKTWKKIPSDVTHIFYLAAEIPYESKERESSSVYEKNLLPLARLIEASSGWRRLKQVIFSSSISVYGASPYGQAKLAGEKLLFSLLPRQVAVACLRYSSLYGVGQYPGTVLPRMIQAAVQKGKLCVYGRGRRTQDFLDCEDAARALFLAYQKKARGIFDIGSGRPASMKELAVTINKVFAGDRAGIHFDRSRSEGESGNRIDTRRAKRLLGYEPAFSLEAGLTKIKQAMNGNHS